MEKINQLSKNELNQLKNLLKEAIVEALYEFMNQGVAIASGGDDGSTGGGSEGTGDIPLGDSNEVPKEDESGKGGASEESSGGGTFGDGRPKPDVGIGVFGLR